MSEAKGEAKVNPVPRPHTEPREDLGSSVSNPRAVVAGRDERPRFSPRYTSQDFKAVVSKIRYDLTAAQAKLTELSNMVNSLELPDEEQPFSEARGMRLVRHTAHEYTDSSLADELALMGAGREFIDRALVVAAEVRRG